MFLSTKGLGCLSYKREKWTRFIIKTWIKRHALRALWFAIYAVISQMNQELILYDRQTRVSLILWEIKLIKLQYFDCMPFGNNTYATVQRCTWGRWGSFFCLKTVLLSHILIIDFTAKPRAALYKFTPLGCRQRVIMKVELEYFLFIKLNKALGFLFCNNIGSLSFW